MQPDTNMAEESERWERARSKSRSRQPFQAKASPVALHTDANRRRNLDKEEAARDRLIFRWVVLIVGIALLMTVLFFLITQLSA